MTTPRVIYREQGEPATPPVVTLLGQKERLEKLWAAANGEQLAFVALCLLVSGVNMPAPVGALPFLQNLVRMGWSERLTATSSPIPGSLWVEVNEEGEPCRVGLVAKLHKDGDQTQRDWFLGYATGEAERVPFTRVAGWVVPPGGCRTCGDRK